MSLRKPLPHLSVAEYLAGEKENPIKHEYVDGQVYAMAGSSDRHNLLAGNIFVRLHAQVSGGPCQVFMADMKVRVAPTVYYYPDVVVACDPPGANAYLRAEPILLVEVISPSTERIDRHEKLAAYQAMPSLREYVLLAQDRMQVELYRRQANGEWHWAVYAEPDESIQLEAVDLNLTVADIYRNVQLPTD